MSGSGKISRGTWTYLALCFLSAFAVILSGCLSPNAEEKSFLRFQNPELTAGLDSLNVLGANTLKGDTLLIHRWQKGEAFPTQVSYPPGLEAAFTLLVHGYLAEVLVYQSRTVIAGGKAQPQVRDFRLAAPALPDMPISLLARVGDAIRLDPVWETRPGIYRQTDSGESEVYTPEAEFVWSRAGLIVGRDSAFALKALAMADSGAYFFSAENRAGKDSLEFRLTVKPMLPRIAEIKPQAAIPGKPLTVKAIVTRSDALLFRWTKNGVLVSTDSLLAFAALSATDTGTYQLAVANASDTTETTVSNRFYVGFAPDPDEIWKPDKVIWAGAQGNSTYGTVLDLDGGKALFFKDASDKEALLDLLLVFSGGAVKFMSPVAARRANDLDYADNFDSTKIHDVKFVKASTKPALPEAGRVAFDKGPQVNSAGLVIKQGFLVKTTDGNLAWVKVDTLMNTTSSSAAAKLIVALAPF